MFLRNGKVGNFKRFMEKIFRGTGVGAGAAWGKARLIHNKHAKIQKLHVKDTKKEIVRFLQAQAVAQKEVAKLHEEAKNRLDEEAAAVFESFCLLLMDEELQSGVKKIIEDEQANAEYALHQVISQYKEVLLGAQSAYMRERCEDLSQVERRLLSALGQEEKRTVALNEKSVIISDNLTPGQIVSMDKEHAAAFVITEGSVYSHAAIIARLLGVPLVVGCEKEVLQAADGTCIAVDVDTGEVIAEPTDARLFALEEKEKKLQEKKMRQRALAGVPCITKGGQKVDLYANISSTSELGELDALGVDGIGLFRSEWLYLGQKGFPTEEMQAVVYGNVLKKMKGKPVVIRTLDAGADKKADYMEFPTEENPAMGVRGIRYSFARPEVFHVQLRALYRASVHGSLKILLPMITSLSQVEKARQMACKVQEELRQENIAFQKVPIGVMIETPAAAIISRELAKESDFFSIGTNDLTQYTLAVDRQNSEAEPYYEKAHPAVFHLIAETVRQAKEHKIPVSICGELGGDTNVTQMLLDCGLLSFSVSPPQVLDIKEKIINCH